MNPETLPIFTIPSRKIAPAAPAIKIGIIPKTDTNNVLYELIPVRGWGKIWFLLISALCAKHGPTGASFIFRGGVTRKRSSAKKLTDPKQKSDSTSLKRVVERGGWKFAVIESLSVIHNFRSNRINFRFFFVGWAKELNLHSGNIWKKKSSECESPFLANLIRAVCFNYWHSETVRILGESWAVPARLNVGAMQC